MAALDAIGAVIDFGQLLLLRAQLSKIYDGVACHQLYYPKSKQHLERREVAALGNGKHPTFMSALDAIGAVIDFGQLLPLRVQLSKIYDGVACHQVSKIYDGIYRIECSPVATLSSGSHLESMTAPSA